MDVDSFLDIFAEPDVLARDLRQKVVELTESYNADNYEVRPARRVADWLHVEKKFVLARRVASRRGGCGGSGGGVALPYVGPPHRSANGGGVLQASEAVEHASELHGILSTFDATLRRRTGELNPTRLKADEVQFQIKMASTDPKFLGYTIQDEKMPAVASGHQKKSEPEPRYDKLGFTYQAVEAARMFGSEEFASFVREVESAFTAHRELVAERRRAAAEPSPRCGVAEGQDVNNLSDDRRDDRSFFVVAGRPVFGNSAAAAAAANPGDDESNQQQTQSLDLDDVHPTAEESSVEDQTSESSGQKKKRKRV